MTHLYSHKDIRTLLNEKNAEFEEHYNNTRFLSVWMEEYEAHYHSMKLLNVEIGELIAEEMEEYEAALETFYTETCEYDNINLRHRTRVSKRFGRKAGCYKKLSSFTLKNNRRKAKRAKLPSHRNVAMKDKRVADRKELVARAGDQEDEWDFNACVLCDDIFRRFEVYLFHY